MLSITFMLCDNMLASSVTLPLELWRAADTINRGRGGLKHRVKSKLQITLASPDGKAVKTHTGIQISADLPLEQIQHSDLIFIPALWRNPSPIIQHSPKLIHWLVKQYKSGAILAGVGTGCWFLAEAKLLENKPATTHWYYFDEFQRRYPNIKLKRAHFITQADNLYCSGSVNAFAELMVHFIEMFYDNDISIQVEKHFFHEIRNVHEGVRAFKETHPDEDIVQAQQWLHDHFAEPVKISTLCTDLQMPVRTFNRRFKNAIGKTPIEYLHNIRMEFARDLLKNTNLAIVDIALRVGYQDPNHFTERFKKSTGSTPREYRVTVRKKLFRPHKQA